MRRLSSIYNTVQWSIALSLYFPPLVAAGHLQPLTGDPAHHRQILRGEAGQGTGQEGVVGRDYKGIANPGLVVVSGN